MVNYLSLFTFILKCIDLCRERWIIERKSSWIVPTFVLSIPAAGCPEWTLQTPSGGEKACSGSVTGEGGSGYACNLACPTDTDFITDPDIYICVFGGTWLPHNWVPDCSDQLFPNYDLIFEVVVTAPGGVPDGCLDQVKSQIDAINVGILCTPYTNNFGFTSSVKVVEELDNNVASLDY